ncbi:uncharacterized protein LOC119181662 isoform X6 [Rhipicephalus microplus]|uniref:uncharacterized protein LOC119181662 isoform X6 n=1 Tax=Rhipicephalus microplus TaxID=6941 RepID=UPI003F6B4A9A
MGGEEKMGQNSAIDGGHGITKQAGTSEDNASGDLELWLLLQPEVGRSLVEKLDGSLDTAQPGTITAPNWQQREGESADGTYEGQYIEMPCLVVLPSDDDNEVENINVQFPISSITKEPLQSTSGADMGVLLLTDDKRPEDKLNAKTEDMDHQDADTTIDNASPTITATVASATSTTMGAPGTTAAVPGTSNSTTPPPDTSATAAPGTATDKTDCLETADNKTDLALPMASCDSSSDAVPSASRTDKAAESAANNSMQWLHSKYLDCEAASEYLSCSAPAELRPEDKLNAKLEDMDHQDADTTIDNASGTSTATTAPGTTTETAHQRSAAVPGTSTSTTPPPDTSAMAAPGTTTEKTDCLETAENKTDLALPMASSNSSSDAVPSASPAGKAAESAANSSMHGQQLKCLGSKATSEHLTCLATAELRPEDKLNAKLEDMDHQDADTTIDNASGTSTATTAPGTTTESAHQPSTAVPGTSTSTTPPPDTSAMTASGTTTEKTDCLETAENKTVLALPMASSDSSSDAVPSASPADKAAESAANSSMHGQQLKCLDSKATSEHLTCSATAELYVTSHKRPEDKLNAKLEDMDHQDADTTIDNASATITATVASATSTTMGAPCTTAAVPGTSNSTTPPPDTSAMAAPGTAIDKTDCLETADNKTHLALPTASCDSSSDAVPSASRTDKAAESAANNSMQWLHSKCLDCEAASEYLTCSAPGELRPEDKLNAKLEDMDHQNADTAIDNASPTITATVASATSTTMGAPGTTAAVPGTSNSTTPPPDTSAMAAPGTAIDKTDCLETAENKTDLALPMASSNSSSDAVSSASTADKAAESAANSSMHGQQLKCLDSKATSEHLTCSATAELRPEDKLNEKLEAMDHQDADTAIDNASATSTATTAPGTTTETAHQPSAAVPGTSTSTTPTPNTSAMAAPGTATEKTDCFETAENKTDLALPMARCDSSSDTVPSASRADSESASEHPTCSAPAELYVTSHKTPEDSMKAELRSVDHQESDTFINNDFLHTAEHASDVPLPMLSRDASEDVVPRVCRVRRKAAEAAINKMMNSTGSTRKKKATNTSDVDRYAHHHKKSSGNRFHECQRRPEDKLNAKLEDMDHQDADTTIDNALPTITATAASGTSTATTAPGITTETAHRPSAAVAGTSTSTTPTPDTSATAAPGIATEKTDCFKMAENKTDLALPMARCDSSSDTVPSASLVNSEAASEHPTCSAPAELYVTSHKTPEDSMKAELRSVDHQESDTFINNDFLHMAEHAHDVPLPMLSRDASEDVLPRVRSMRRKAAESAINNMMNSTGSTRKKKATNASDVDSNAHHHKKSSGNRCHESQRYPTGSVRRKNETKASVVGRNAHHHKKPSGKQCHKCQKASLVDFNTEVKTMKHQDSSAKTDNDSPHESLWHNDEPLLPDFLHMAKHPSDVPLPMLSRDASEDVVPRVCRVRRKAAETAINKMMNSSGSTRKKKGSNTSDVCSNAHHLKKPSEKRRYNCQICEQLFARKPDLAAHLRMHASDKPYKCGTCTKSFKRKAHFWAHTRTHTQEKPYHCHLCAKSFTQQCNLQAHIRTHTGEKPYHCHICTKSFTQQGNLGAHLRTHTGEKPYHCHLCSKSFAQKCQMVVHLRTHTGEKPFKCSKCTLSFAQPANLRVHERLHVVS